MSYRISVLNLFVALGVSAFAIPAQAATYTVNVFDSSVNTGGCTTITTCSLADAINAANATTANDVIDLGGNTITLTTADTTDSSNGLPQPVATTTGGKLTIQNGSITRGNTAPVFRLLLAQTGSDLTFDKVTLSNGHAPDGAINTSANPGSDGGAINSSGTLTIRNSTFLGNNAGNGNFGGAGGNGGGISSSGVLTVSNSTFSGNTVGIGNANVSGSGGAISSSGTLTISNSTFSGVVSRSTLSSNAAPTLNSNIFSGTANVCSGFAGSATGANNLITDTSCGTGTLLVNGTITTTAALNLDTLKNNGGPTQTIALLNTSSTGGVKSAAIQAGGTCGVSTDQRGAPRLPGACSVGAYEYGAMTFSDINGKTIGIVSSNGAVTSASLSNINQSLLPTGYTYPNGVFGFTISNLNNPGDTATVTVVLPTGSAANAYIKCNSSNVCTPFAGASFNGNVMTLTLTDNGAGDTDGARDGNITDPGATAVGSGSSGSLASGGGALGASTLLMLLLPAGWRWRRALRAESD